MSGKVSAPTPGKVENKKAAPAGDSGDDSDGTEDGDAEDSKAYSSSESGWDDRVKSMVATEPYLKLIQITTLTVSNQKEVNGQVHCRFFIFFFF